MKKILISFLALVLLLSVGACATAPDSSTDTPIVENNDESTSAVSTTTIPNDASVESEPTVSTKNTSTTKSQSTTNGKPSQSTSTSKRTNISTQQTITTKSSSNKTTGKSTTSTKATTSTIKATTTTTKALALVESEMYLFQNDTYQLRHNLSSNANITWESSDETVASVDENGQITTYSFGTTTITAKCGSTVDTVDVYVYKISAPRIGEKFSRGDTIFEITDLSFSFDRYMLEANFTLKRCSGNDNPGFHYELHDTLFAERDYCDFYPDENNSQSYSVNFHVSTDRFVITLELS